MTDISENSVSLNVSMQHCLKVTSWCFKVQPLARALIEVQSYLVEICLGVIK